VLKQFGLKSIMLLEVIWGECWGPLPCHLVLLLLACLLSFVFFPSLLMDLCRHLQGGHCRWGLGDGGGTPFSLNSNIIFIFRLNVIVPGGWFVFCSGLGWGEYACPCMCFEVICFVTFIGGVIFGGLFLSMWPLFPPFDGGPCAQGIKVSHCQQRPQFLSIWVLKCNYEGGRGACLIECW
jgi:hypothetical protein